MATDEHSTVAARGTNPQDDTILAPRRSRIQKLGLIARQNPLAAVATVILITVVAASAAAPIVSPHDPLQHNLGDNFISPGMEYYLGTDNFGRDVLSRLLHGAQLSLFIAFAATFMGVGAGSVIGIVSGFAGGWLDLIIQRFVDAIMAIPGLILLLTLVMIMGAGASSVIVALTIFIIPPSVRIVRGHTMTVSNEAYIDAARVIGASYTRILVRYILPNVFATIIVAASVVIGAVILAEAAIGFLGLGVTEPTPTWGNMLSVGAQQHMEQAPWMAITPGVLIVIVVGAFNLLGDGLRDVLDPRLRGR